MQQTSGNDWSKAGDVYGAFDRWTRVFASAAANELIRNLTEVVGTDVNVPCVESRRVVVADFATGAGAGVLALVQACASQKRLQCDIEGSDSSPAMIALALRQLRTLHTPPVALPPSVTKVRFSVVDMTNMVPHVASQTLDGWTCIFGVMFPQSPCAAAKELFRALRPGGCGVVVTWHYNGALELRREVARYLLSSGQCPTIDVTKAAKQIDHVLSFGNERQLRTLFGEAGFEVLSCRFVSSADGEMTPHEFAGMCKHTPATAIIFKDVSDGTIASAATQVAELRRELLPNGNLKLYGTALVASLKKPFASHF